MTAPKADSAVRSARLAFLAGALVTTAIALLDIAVGEDHVYVTAVMAGPVIALLGASERQVTVLAVYAFAIAIISGAWNDNFGETDWLIRVVLVAVGGSAAILAARSRAGERQQLNRMGLLADLGEVADGSLSVGAAAERIVAVLVPRLADMAAVDAVSEGEERRLAEAGRGARGTVATPLQTRGRAIGTLTVAMGDSGRELTTEDAEFLRVAAGRAALALDNSGLSSELSVVERQLAAALVGLAEAVTVQDAHGKVVYANQAAAELLGYRTPADVIATPTPAIVARYRTTRADGRPLELAELPGRRVLAGEDPEPLLMRVEDLDTGEEGWRVVKASAVRDAAGRVQFAVNVVEDVTEVKRAELAQRLLSEASRALAGSLEWRETIERVASIAVPALADWCTIHMPTERGTIELVGIAHVDPLRLETARALEARFPARLDDKTGLAATLRDGEPQLVPEITTDVLAASARDPEHLEALLEISMRSALTVPMQAGTRVTGVVTLVNSHARRPFTPADLEIAAELGRRAGTAIENARLYQERAALANTLQADLLPPELPPIPGWVAAAMYRAAGDGADVGGDFYDAFPVEGGWILVVGDVAGRGPAAASLTAMARYTLRTAASLTGDAAEAVRMLNRQLTERSRMALVSVCVVQLHEDGEVTVVAAGHPDPYVIRDGEATPLKVAGPLLGALEDGDWPVTTVALAPGDQLVLYTDGVIDAQGADERFGEERLGDTLAGATGAADAVARIRDALEDFATGERRDDRAVLALERAGAPALNGEGLGVDGRHHAQLPRGSAAPATARRAIEAWLAGRLDERQVADVRLLVSELVTNGVLHATRREGDVLDLVATVSGEGVRVEVHDPGPGFVPGAIGPPPPDSPGGRGLLLVDRIASRWGVDRGQRTCVWFEIDA